MSGRAERERESAVGGLGVGRGLAVGFQTPKGRRGG